MMRQEERIGGERRRRASKNEGTINFHIDRRAAVCTILYTIPFSSCTHPLIYPPYNIYTHRHCGFTVGDTK